MGTLGLACLLGCNSSKSNFSKLDFFKNVIDSKIVLRKYSGVL